MQVRRRWQDVPGFNIVGERTQPCLRRARRPQKLVPMRRLGAHATLGRRRARQRTSRARSDRRRVTRGTTLRRNGRLGRHMRWNHSVSYSWLEPAAGASVMRRLELLACANCGLLCTPMASCCCTMRHELSSGVQLKLDPTGGGSLCTVGQRPSGTAAKWDSGQVGQWPSGTVAKWDGVSNRPAVTAIETCVRGSLLQAEPAATPAWLPGQIATREH